MCGTTKKLPTSCTISPQVLTVGSQPVTSGSSGDVYEGSLDGTSVRVKIVRESSKDDPQEAIRVLRLVVSMFTAIDGIYRPSSKMP